jgi:hypothetical protein
VGRGKKRRTRKKRKGMAHFKNKGDIVLDSFKYL